MIALLVKTPITKDFHTYKPWQVTADVKGICARGRFLHLFVSPVEMMVSDVQGNTQRDLIKHKVVFIKYLMTASKGFLLGTP